VLGPARVDTVAVDDDLLRRVIGLAAGAADVVILHLPRDMSPVARWCFEQADRIVEVLTLDVLSFRASSRALDALGPLALGTRIGFVVNRASRSELTAGDVRRVFDADPLVVVPADASIPRLQDHGRLAPPRGRVGRAFDRLAQLVVGEPEPVAEEAS
jgi:Flp pilus assembly CpaE family ATPase